MPVTWAKFFFSLPFSAHIRGCEMYTYFHVGGREFPLFFFNFRFFIPGGFIALHKTLERKSISVDVGCYNTTRLTGNTEKSWIIFIALTLIISRTPTTTCLKSFFRSVSESEALRALQYMLNGKMMETFSVDSVLITLCVCARSPPPAQTLKAFLQQYSHNSGASEQELRVFH